jgi:hypothetical protein
LTIEDGGYGAIHTINGHMDFFTGLINYPPGSPERLEYARHIASVIGIQGPNVPD